MVTMNGSKEDETALLWLRKNRPEFILENHGFVKLTGAGISFINSDLPIERFNSNVYKSNDKLPESSTNLERFGRLLLVTILGLIAVEVILRVIYNSSIY